MMRFAASAAESITQEESPNRRQSGWKTWLLTAGLAGALLIAGFSYLLGLRNFMARIREGEPVTLHSSPAERATATEAVPSATNSLLTGQAVGERIAPAPGPSAQASTHRAATTEELKSPAPEPQKIAPPAQSREALLDHTSSSKTAGNLGEGSDQMVRLGRYSSQREAEEAWAVMVRKWPDLRTMSAAPVPINSLRDGQAYYRLQVRTNSQEGSENMCLRMHDMDQSCTIMGVDKTSAETPF